ncbi:unnamed protein product [Trifolium pratense]|uniref:Uncharacterized protein n=1 Tax=Trifolium pratense TaxID=57577 RepID=A0ACB0ILI0_TRIPR|nr:unnamed protein product [Trifolium pratense]
MRRTGPQELQFDPEIEKTARAIRKATREAQASRGTTLLRDTPDCQGRTAATMEEEQVPPVPQPPRRTLGDYGRRDNDALANQGFQPANPVSFDIKNTVLSALKENPYSGSEAQCPNLHLSHFYEACDYTDPPGVSESDKRLRLFKHSLTGRAKDWLDTIPAGTIETWRQLERKFLDRYFPIHKLTGKGKKKSDANPPQEPPKKPRTKMSASKGQSSRSAEASPPRRSNVTQPQVHPHFISAIHEKRYTKIQTFTINQEKGFGEDLLKGVAEIGNEVKSRKWGKFNKLMIKDEANPGNQMWVREFLANAYLPDQSSVPEFYSTVRGIRVYYSAAHINTLLGCRVRGACELVSEKERISNGGLAVREELKAIVCRPGARWLPHSASSLPTRLSLTSFNPIHRAWGEFWLKNVRVVGNNSEIQIDNVAAVRLLAEGRYIDLGLWLQRDLHEMANNNNPTFTLGHCNLIAALCRASNVPMCVQEGDLHPVRPLALSYFEKRFERGPIVPRGEGNAAREEALREEEEINRFEEGNHPNQQGDPAYESQEIPAHAPPPYSHDMNQLASMLHQMEISQYSGLPNLYFDTASSMYTEAMTYRSTFPPPTFGTLYPIDTDWEAHQARELNSFQARQAYNSGLRTSELAEIERRRRVEQDEAAAMEREMLDVDGLNLNLNSPFTNYFTGQPDDAV